MSKFRVNLHLSIFLSMKKKQAKSSSGHIIIAFTLLPYSIKRSENVPIQKKYQLARRTSRTEAL